MNWTEILSRAGVPESPGYEEAVRASQQKVVERKEREHRQLLEKSQQNRRRR